MNSGFVSYMYESEEYVHSADCSRGVRDARKAQSPLTPVPGCMRDLLVLTFADIWSDTYTTAEEAIAAGMLESYAPMVHLSPCAIKAGFRTDLTVVETWNVHVTVTQIVDAPSDILAIRNLTTQLIEAGFYPIVGDFNTTKYAPTATDFADGED